MTTINQCTDLIKKTVQKKNQAYGSAFERTAQIMEILYSDQIQPGQYHDASLMVRVVDKLCRIATDNDPTGENPWLDIGGYAVLGMTVKEEKLIDDGDESGPVLEICGNCSSYERRDRWGANNGHCSRDGILVHREFHCEHWAGV